MESERISNVVFMGMGEPLANYDNVKEAIQTWLDHTDLGPTKITVSSVGVVNQLEKILTDPTWPDVRIAISLHSANQRKREEIVPTTAPQFLNFLADWSHRYAAVRGNRTHHITYEYILIDHVNDTPELALELARYIKKTAYSKVNVIPYNPVTGKSLARSDRTRIVTFKDVLRQHGIDVTERKTMGDDIAAACGQLVVSASQ
jgi:23S rRNA (adenine2503-C2)-methyltransferase